MVTRAQADPIGYERALSFLITNLTSDTNAEHPLRVGVEVEWHREATDSELSWQELRRSVNEEWNSRGIDLTREERIFLVENLISPKSLVTGTGVLSAMRKAGRSR